MSAAQMAELNCIIQDAQKTNELLLVSQGLDSSRLVGGRVRHLEGSEGRGEETPKLVYSPLQSMGKPLDFSLPPPHPHLSNGHPYQQQHQPSAIPSGSSQLRMNQPHHFSPSQHSHQDQPLLPPPYNQALNHNHVPRNLPSTSQANVPGGAQRKADYVIVTEDTAVKNAAGAIAKVLGRVCGQVSHSLMTRPS